MSIGRTRCACVLLVACTIGLNGRCTGIPCEPGDPSYDPMTGLCPSTQPADGDDDSPGPAGPGTGGLPTEPDTDTPVSAGDGVDPNNVNVDVFGLNGLWLDNDNGEETCIFHTGSEVGGNYRLERACNHFDGAGTVTYTLINFRGTLADGVITGTTSFCTFGFDEPGVNGWSDTPMMLTVGADGKTLSGTWYDPLDDEDIPFELTRMTVGNCGVQ